jgi:hypothetical protein
MNLINFFSIFFLLSTSFFEGVIIYHNYSEDCVNIIDKLYLAPNKLRIDTEAYSKHEYNKVVRIFDFSNPVKIYYESENDGPFVLLPTRDKSDAIIKYRPDSIIQHMGFSCFLVEIAHEHSVIIDDIDVHSLSMRKVYLAENLKYQIPDDWVMDHHMVLNFDDRIALRMDFEYSTPIIDTNSGFTREAVAILPMKLPPQVFEVK